MPAQNWRDVYKLALLELDISNLPGRVRAALQAIQQRLRQKKEALNQKEREEISDALRALVEVVRRRAAQGRASCGNGIAGRRISQRVLATRRPISGGRS